MTMADPNSTMQLLGMAEASSSSSNVVSVFEAIVALMNCLLLLGAAYILLDHFLQNRQLRAAAHARAGTRIA